MVLHITRTNEAVDERSMRSLSGNLSAVALGKWLAACDAKLPAYIEVWFDVVEDVPQRSIEEQLADKHRRLAAIGRACGRSIVRMEQQLGMIHKYRALLAR